MIRFAIAALLATGLAACGGDAGNSSAGGGGGFEESFWRNFTTEFTASCERSAKAGPAAAVAERYCGCALDKVKAQFGMAEAMNLSTDKMKPIMEQCAREVGINPGGLIAPPAEGPNNG